MGCGRRLYECRGASKGVFCEWTCTFRREPSPDHAGFSNKRAIEPVAPSAVWGKLQHFAAAKMAAVLAGPTLLQSEK